MLSETGLSEMGRKAPLEISASSLPDTLVMITWIVVTGFFQGA